MYITQGLKRAAQINPKGIATINGTRKKNWQSLLQRVSCLGGALRKLGVAADDKVAILSLNNDRYYEFYYGVNWIAAITVPLNVRLSPPELKFLMQDANCKVLLVDEYLKGLLPHFADLPLTVIYLGDDTPPANTLAYEALISESHAVTDVLAGGADISGIFYTGGTSGIPKGVMLSHDNLVSNALNIAIILKHDQSSIYLHSAPMFHLADIASTCSITMAAGTHVFIPKFHPEHTLSMIESHQVTHLTLVPIMAQMMVNDPAIENHNISSLIYLACGGSAMPMAVMDSILAALPDCQLIQAYGMTELSGVLTILPDAYQRATDARSKKRLSVGRVVSNMECRIVDSNDQTTAPGQVGEVLARGPVVMKGYWNREEESCKALKNGWLYTGDLGYMDEDGFVFITDRNKDMIISGGENIYSIEIENILQQHPDVNTCAVIGVPSKEWGEAVLGIVHLLPDSTVSAKTLIDHCKTYLSHFKVPQQIVIHKEPLPLSGVGKIMKSKLREPYWQGHSRRIN